MPVELVLRGSQLRVERGHRVPVGILRLLVLLVPLAAEAVVPLLGLLGRAVLGAHPLPGVPQLLLLHLVLPGLQVRHIRGVLDAAHLLAKVRVLSLRGDATLATAPARAGFDVGAVRVEAEPHVAARDARAPLVLVPGAHHLIVRGASSRLVEIGIVRVIAVRGALLERQDVPGRRLQLVRSPSSRTTSSFAVFSSSSMAISVQSCFAFDESLTSVAPSLLARSFFAACIALLCLLGMRAAR